MLPTIESKLPRVGTTIFTVMSSLAAELGAVNLGQGYPDFPMSDELISLVDQAMREGYNQYVHVNGLASLREVLAEKIAGLYGTLVDSATQITITPGGTYAIYTALTTVLRPGDEVIVFEPAYDSYIPNIEINGAIPVRIDLRFPDYHIDWDEVRRRITPRTRMILLNSPHNPTGMVLSRAELTAIAELAVERDLLVVTDEVYEHIVFDGEHIPLASLPGMRERTVSVSSAGKTFSFTGWKVGWVTGTPELVSAVRTTKQFLTFVASGPFQYAVAGALGLDDDFYATLGSDLRRKRDLLAAGLARAGLQVFPPQGTYFLTADISPLGEQDGVNFCRTLPARCGVVAVPNAVFYDDQRAGRSHVRFAFCKRDEVLADAAGRLEKLAAR